MRRLWTVPTLMIVVGCAAPTPSALPPSTSTASAPTSAVAGTTPSSTTSAGASPTAPDPSWNGSGASYGVDRARWPTTLDAARPVLRSLPAALGGARKEYHSSAGDRDDPGPEAGVRYGDVGSVTVYEEYVTRDTASGKPELLSANNQLATSFGLGLVCGSGTYRGTAPKPTYPARPWGGRAGRPRGS